MDLLALVLCLRQIIHDLFQYVEELSCFLCGDNKGLTYYVGSWLGGMWGGGAEDLPRFPPPLWSACSLGRGSVKLCLV